MPSFKHKGNTKHKNNEQIKQYFKIDLRILTNFICQSIVIQSFEGFILANSRSALQKDPVRGGLNYHFLRFIVSHSLLKEANELSWARQKWLLHGGNNLG